MESGTAVQNASRKRVAPDAENRFVSVKGAAEILHLSEQSVRRFLTERKLRRFKVGARTLLDREQVLSLIKEV